MLHISPIGKQLVLYLGETRDIVCTAPNEDHLAINWGPNGLEESFEDIKLGDTYSLQNGLKGRNLTLTATPEINNTNLDCGIYNRDEPMNSYSSLEILVLIQGL